MQTAVSCVKATCFVCPTFTMNGLSANNNVTLFLPLRLTDNSHYSHRGLYKELNLDLLFKGHRKHKALTTTDQGHLVYLFTPNFAYTL